VEPDIGHDGMWINSKFHNEEELLHKKIYGGMAYVSVFSESLVIVINSRMYEFELADPKMDPIKSIEKILREHKVI